MKNERTLGIILIFILIPVFTTVLSLSLNAGRISLHNNSVTVFNSGWALKSKSKAYQTIELPNKIDVPANEEIILSNNLPRLSVDSPALFFKTQQQAVKVLIDNRLIYEYSPDHNWFGNSPGNAVHCVDLPDQYAGNNIEIMLVSPYKPFSGLFDEVSLGDRGSLIMNLINEDIFLFVISLIITMFGIIVFTVYISLYFSGVKNSSILYLSLFSLFSGLWMLSGRTMLNLFTKDPVFTSNLNYLTLYCLPIPLLLFIRKTYQPKRGKILVDLSWAFVLFALLATVLQIINVTDYVAILPVYHMLILSAFVIIMAYIGMDEIIKATKGLREFFYGLLIFGILIIIDIVRFYWDFPFKLRSNSFCQIGILLFIIIITSSVGQNYFYLRDMQIRNKMLLSLAYTDALTRLKNRMSFDEMIRALNSNLDSEKSVHLVILDINNLKNINDTLGHKEGDRLIIEGSRLMRDTLGKLGEIYRIGGDEFAMIIRNTEESIINNAISELFEQIDRYNKAADKFSISIAYGMAAFTKGLDNDLHSVFVRADKAMYNCKINQKHIKVIE